jgi:hypothetical protein
MLPSSYLDDSKPWLRTISDERLTELAKRIKPVVRFAEGEEGLFVHSKGSLYYIKDVDLRKTAFTWDPEADRLADTFTTICDIQTYHSWSYYGFFKPSIAEVLTNIPEEFLEQVVAFEIVSQPETAYDFGGENQEAFDDSFHVATTRLYKIAG